MVVSYENKNLFQQNKNMFLTKIISLDAMEHIFHRIHKKIKNHKSFHAYGNNSSRFQSLRFQSLIEELHNSSNIVLYKYKIFPKNQNP